MLLIESFCYIVVDFVYWCVMEVFDVVFVRSVEFE